MELSVLKIDGSESGKKVVLDEKVFGVTPNDHAIYLDVLQYLAHQRQGTARTKDRSEISYSTKKQGRQKGGGGARHGSLKSNIYVGGGRAHGPKPRCYDMKLNKKVKQLARVSALSYKAQENKIVLVEPFAMEAPKTKEFITFVENLKIADKKVLVALNGIDKNMFLSARNLKKANVTTANQLNTYGILDAGVLVLTESALKDIEAVLNK